MQNRNWHCFQCLPYIRQHNQKFTLSKYLALNTNPCTNFITLVGHAVCIAQPNTDGTAVKPGELYMLFPHTQQNYKSTAPVPG